MPGSEREARIAGRNLPGVKRELEEQKSKEALELLGRSTGWTKIAERKGACRFIEEKEVLVVGRCSYCYNS